MRPGATQRRPAQTDDSVGRRHRPDYWLPLLSTGLLGIGLIVIYSISPGLAGQNNVSENYYVSRQLMAILLGVVAFLVMANVPITFWRSVQKPLIILAVVASLAVRLVGEEVNGAYRWIQLGGMSFQAVELIKFALLIWFASFLADRLARGELSDQNRTLKPMFIALVLIGVVVAFLQSDFGSTAVMVAMMAAMTFVVGMPLKKIVMIGAIVGIGGLLLISSTPYRRERLTTFLNPQQDCQNEGYQSCQALIAVGSGGIFGLGLAQSVQAYGYLPEAQNDSIFAIYAEKFGFVGVTVLIGMFMALFARLFKIIEHTPDIYSRLIVTGILAWLSTQALINMGAMLGVLPLKGITLPFISYGGTSLLFITGVIGLAFQISRYTSYGRINTNSYAQGTNPESATDRRGNRRPHNPVVSRRP
jgi:cell division protein FtsW